MQDRRA